MSARRVFGGACAEELPRSASLSISPCTPSVHSKSRSPRVSSTKQVSTETVGAIPTALTKDCECVAPDARGGGGAVHRARGKSDS